MKFVLHDTQTAPTESKPLLENSIKSFGMIPNLHAVLAESPATLEAYQNLHKVFQQTSFNSDELTVVWQTINVEHNCHYCIPAHTYIAHSMNVDKGVIDALNNRTELPTKKLQILHKTVLALIVNRGHLSEQQLEAFSDAAYTQQNILEILLGIAQKVISNYSNHLSKTPIDEPFKKFSL